MLKTNSALSQAEGLLFACLSLLLPAAPAVAQASSGPSSSHPDSVVSQTPRLYRGQLKKHRSGSAGRSIQPYGLLQIWYGNAFGQPLAGLSPNGVRPRGRSYSGGIGDALRLRRAEIGLLGLPPGRAYWNVKLDAARVQSGQAAPLSILYAGYRLGGGLRLELGQQKTGLSEEGTRSSSDLLTVARSIMNELPLKAGRIGDVYDLGVVLKYGGSLFDSSIGIWNGNGTSQNRFTVNNTKFLDGTLYFKGIRHTTLGIWGGTNVGGSSPTEVRDRAGATFLFHSGPHYVESEVAYARDYAAGAPAPGRTGSINLAGYVLYGYRLSRKWQVVAR
ncbi:MAG TPA: porin, partial [Chthonomonadales bacterium]|nr:porin [Chthonomonadales bacterium]